MENKKYRIAVLLGGISAERDVSIVTGINIARGLKENGHEVIAIDTAYGKIITDFIEINDEISVKKIPPNEELLKQLKNNIFKTMAILVERKIDLTFIGLHGGYGENGQLQALLELSGIPFTGTGSVGSAICMDKHYSKVLAASLEIECAKWICFNKKEQVFFPQNIKLPFVVKPNDQGSTVGLSIVKNKMQYKKATELAFENGNSIMVEEFIPGRELTVSILGDKALPVIEIKPDSGFYDYEAKYQGGQTIYEVPAEIPNEVADKIKKWSELIFEELKCKHYGRVDFRYDEKSGRICFLEINNLPGMTTTSLVPKAAKAVGISFNKLLEKIINFALAE